MINQILCDVFTGRGQESAPFDFIVPNCSLVSDAGIVTRSGMQVMIDFAHEAAEPVFTIV
ncbi:hypothetical protein ACO0LD_05730 [Undibacterium sp. Ji83W]|uniref:hypothetical protein n=1 Tax=Undibacterium sp. Ji83W TaxID=3413043 RepID=UPI003BF0742A